MVLPISTSSGMSHLGSMTLSPGTILTGRYRLQQFLGQGGMGQVWSGIQTVTGRAVAIKVLQLCFARDGQAHARFILEGRAACAVDHPNVVEILDFVEAGDELPLLVMELLRGETLAAKLARDRAIAVHDMARLLLPVVSAVGTAHSRGIVHRDLKPANIFLSQRGEAEPIVKVLDFGIAKWLIPPPGESGLRTQTGLMLGTPSYMAPEQAICDRTLDHKVDIWSLGVIMYECLSGSRPIECHNAAQLIMRLLHAGIVPIESVLPDIPADLARVIRRMLARDRSHRPRDLQEVFQVLARYSDVAVPMFGEPCVVPSGPADESRVESPGDSVTPGTPSQHSFGSMVPRARRLPRAAPSGPLPEPLAPTEDPDDLWAPDQVPYRSAMRRRVSRRVSIVGTLVMAASLGLGAMRLHAARSLAPSVGSASERKPPPAPVSSVEKGSSTPRPASTASSDQPMTGWVLAGDDPFEYAYASDSAVKHGGHASGSLRSVVPKPKGFGTLMQSFSADAYRGKRMQLSAEVKTDNVVRGGELWMRVDSLDMQPLAFDNMQDRPIKGTTNWTVHKVVLDVPQRAGSIHFGVMLGGTGQMWIDDVLFEPVSSKVATTDLMKNKPKWRSPLARWLPKSASNLNFEIPGLNAPMTAPKEGATACAGTAPATPTIVGTALSPAADPFSVAAKGLTPATVTYTDDPKGGPRLVHVDADSGVPSDIRSEWAIFGFVFEHPACLDASAFTGIRFTLSGDLGECIVVFSLLPSNDSSKAFGGQGTCTAEKCEAPGTKALSLGETLVRFADLSSGSPYQNIDAAALVGLQWTIHSGTAGCKANFDVSDVSFVGP